MKGESPNLSPEPLPDLHLDMAAAGRVLNCQGSGLRAYALAGGLDPASDFQGLDLCGWDLAGQDLSGFNFADCDLRGTGIEHAIVDQSTRLDGALLDDSIVAGSSPELLEMDEGDLNTLALHAEGLWDTKDYSGLAKAGGDLLPLLESRFGVDHPDIIRLAGLIGYGEPYENKSARALARLTRLIASERAQETLENRRSLLLWGDGLGQVLLNLGRAQEALAVYETLLPLYVKVRGAEDRSTLTTRGMRARALLDLGRAQEAFAEYEALLPLDVKVRGAKNHATLYTRELRARALLELGRAQEAFAEYEALLPLNVKVLGAEDRSTLNTTFMRASALLDLGRAQEAFAAYEALLPLDVKVRGAEDTSTLYTRHIRARALLDLGRAQEALHELANVTSGFAKAIGNDHWWLSDTRCEEIGCRMALGAVGVSNDLRHLSEHIAKESFPHALPALRARYRLTRALIMEDKPAEALVEIGAILALAEAQAMTGYRYVEATRRLSAVLAGTDDGIGLPW